MILELLEAEGRVIHGLFDDNATADNLFDYPVKPWPEGYSEGADCIISIGHNATRQKIAQKLEVPFTKASHPNSYLSPRCSLENGTVVMSGVSIHSGASIGRHCIINTHASVDHDCELGDFVHIAPHAVLCGHVRVGEGCLIGAGAVIIPGVSIGRWAVIGAGAVIRKDVPDYVTAVGNPARLFLLTTNQDEHAK